MPGVDLGAGPSVGMYGRVVQKTILEFDSSSRLNFVHWSVEAYMQKIRRIGQLLDSAVAC